MGDEGSLGHQRVAGCLLEPRRVRCGLGGGPPAHREARLDVLLSAVSLPTIFYVARRHAGIDRARLAVAESLVSFEIVPVGRSTLETARTFPGPDFEDNLQVACAVEAHLDAIVTRNPSDYAGSPVPALLPAQILDQIPGQ